MDRAPRAGTPIDTDIEDEADDEAHMVDWDTVHVDRLVGIAFEIDPAWIDADADRFLCKVHQVVQERLARENQDSEFQKPVLDHAREATQATVPRPFPTGTAPKRSNAAMPALRRKN